jgi:glycosyltransferase involved in cell wall biosynthesis
MRSEFINFNNQYITKNILEADVVWLLFNWIWRQTPIDLLASKKVVTTIHHIDPEKLDLNDFLMRDRFIDAYHVFSEKTIPHFPEAINKNKIHIVPYWYNERLWSATDKKKDLREKLQIPTNKLVIGSFQRDTEGFDLKTPKLSKGPDIFCDILEQLHPKPHVLLSGWRRQYVINRLKNAGITYSYFEMANFKDLNELYNCLDLYLVTSRHEGGPQAVLECSSNKTPILSTDVGFANKVLTQESILGTVGDFVNKIQSKSFDNVNENYKNIQNYRMEKTMPQYIKFFQDI